MPALLQRKIDLSIIVPCYNLENYIQPFLDSLKAQKQTHNVEIIFVLNNCTDNTERVIRDNGFCYILECKTQGCGPARNVGLEHAKGEYVWFMDGDDYLLKPTAACEAIEKAQGKDIIRIPFKSNGFHREYFSMVWQYVMRRKFIEGIWFPSIQPCEDDYFMERVLDRAGYDRGNYTYMPSVDEPLYYYNYLREGSNMFRYLCLREKI